MPVIDISWDSRKRQEVSSLLWICAIRNKKMTCSTLLLNIGKSSEFGWMNFVVKSASRKSGVKIALVAQNAKKHWSSSVFGLYNSKLVIDALNRKSLNFYGVSLVTKKAKKVENNRLHCLEPDSNNFILQIKPLPNEFFSLVICTSVANITQYLA